ncbi:hypothetical protein VZT92_023880 [Zoarces viviparus]|uniref:OB domain-containing protein n=1 Tax=Zoarces viviparus TaxID=48416 RepID=A0AAW1E7S3_ZOAVI
MVAEQSRVVAWEFDASGGRELRFKGTRLKRHKERDDVFSKRANTQELKQQAEALCRPLSPLTPLSSCSDAKGRVTVEGEVIELSTLRKITKGKDVFPMRNIKLQQGDTQLLLCLWREASVDKKLQIGGRIKVSHLKVTQSGYGMQLQSTNFSRIEKVSSEDVVGAFGVMDVEDEPGTLNLLLDEGRTVTIAEALWTPIEQLLN